MSEAGRSPSVEPGYSSDDDVLKQIGEAAAAPVRTATGASVPSTVAASCCCVSQNAVV